MMSSTGNSIPLTETHETELQPPQTGAESDQQCHDRLNNDPSITVEEELKHDTIANKNDSHLHGFRLAAVVVGVCLGSLMMSLDVTIIATAIPSITTSFHEASGSATTSISWYPAAFTLATCSLTPLAGKLAAVFPLPRVYISFMLVFLVGTIVCGASTSSAMLIAGRAIAGAGSAGVAANGMTILVRVAEPRKKPMMVGCAAACFALGLVLAPVIGGALTAKAGWRWCFWVNLPVAAVSSVVILLFFPHWQLRNMRVTSSGHEAGKDRHGDDVDTGVDKSDDGNANPGSGGKQDWWIKLKRLDLVGFGLFLPAIFMLLFALEEGGQRRYSWNSATVIGLLVGFTGMAILFVAWEVRKGSGAMIPPEVIRRRTVLFAVLFAFFQMGSLTIATYYVPLWFQAVDGVDPLESGVRYLATVVTQIVMTMVASSLVIRIKYYNPWFFLSPLFLITSSALFSQMDPHTSKAQWIGYQIIQGVAGGWGMQMSSLAVQLELKDESSDLLPVGIALVSFLQYLGASVMQVVAGAVFASRLREELALLKQIAGLTDQQIGRLLESGTKQVMEVALGVGLSGKAADAVVEAWNKAIVGAFYVPLAGGGIAFFLAFGIKWTKIEGAGT